MSNLTSRQLIKALFTQTKLPRLPFIPWIFTHAAKLEQLPVSDMFSDPNQYAKAIQNAQKLYGYDAIANVFDPSLEAEACGCQVTWGDDYKLPIVSTHPLNDIKQIPDIDIYGIEKKGRLPVVLEATKRIKSVMGREVAMVGVVTGPFALANRLAGMDIAREMNKNAEEIKKIIEFAGQVVVKVCQAYCELMPDLIALVDDSLLYLLPEHFPQVISVLRPVFNSVSFYDAKLILLTNGYYPEGLEALVSLKADAVVIPSTLELESTTKVGFVRNSVIGDAIPIPVLTGRIDQLRKYLRGYMSENIVHSSFLSTAWEVPSETPPENLHEISKFIASSTSGW